MIIFFAVVYVVTFLSLYIPHLIKSGKKAKEFK